MDGSAAATVRWPGKLRIGEAERCHVVGGCGLGIMLLSTGVATGVKARVWLEMRGRAALLGSSVLMAGDMAPRRAAMMPLRAESRVGEDATRPSRPPAAPIVQ